MSTAGYTIDVRQRCARLRCNKLPRGKKQDAEYQRYAPYCSYHCQQWAQLEDAKRYLNSLEQA